MQDNSSHSTASGSYAARLRPTEEQSQEVLDSWRKSRNRARDKWFNQNTKNSGRFDFVELEKRLSESGNHPVYNPDNYPLQAKPHAECVAPQPALSEEPPIEIFEPDTVLFEPSHDEWVQPEHQRPEWVQTSWVRSELVQDEWLQPERLQPQWELPSESQTELARPAPQPLSKSLPAQTPSEAVVTMARIMSDLGLT